MLIVAASLLTALDLFSGSGRTLTHVGPRTVAKVIASLSGEDEQVTGESGADEDTDTDDDSSASAPHKSIVIHRGKFRFEMHGDDEEADVRITEKGKDVGTVDLLHRIANRAGWSMTIVGSPRETVDVDVKNAKPREALRQVLQRSGAMGVLKSDRLVVVASPDSDSAGMLVEETDRHGPAMVMPPIPPIPAVPPVPAVPAVPAVPPVPPVTPVPDVATAPEAATPQPGRRRSNRGGNDVVRFFSDVTVRSGEVVQGDVVCIKCDVELEPGAIVRGNAVALGGSVVVNQGALVLEDAVALLGEVEVARGAQVLGEHIQVGLGRIFGGRARGARHTLLSLGPFGLFPTLALFALIYLVGLLALRMWPERVRMVGLQLFESPVRSFFVGFLCWILFVPLLVLLCVSIVGIPLIPVVPVAMFLSIVLGMSALALRIGDSLPAGPGQRFVPPAALGMGMLTLLLLGMVPWLGVSLLALVQFFALGSAVSSRFGRALPPHV